MFYSQQKIVSLLNKYAVSVRIVALVRCYQRCPGLWGGGLQEFTRKNEGFTRKMSPTVPRAVPWTSQSTKLNAQVSPRYPRVVGVAVTNDSCIIVTCVCIGATFGS